MATKTPTRIEAVGRRKTAIARVRLSPAARQSVVVNGKDIASYFATSFQRKTVLEPLTPPGTYAVSALVKGGGLSAQAEAIRHGIARALVKHEPESRKRLKHEGYLKRDPRAKERRKFGLKKARKAAQWAKR